MFISIIGIGIYGMREMKIMSRNTQTLYTDRVVPMNQLSTIRFYYINDIVFPAQNAKNHQISFSEAKKQIEEAQEQINTLWKAYLLTDMTQVEDQKVKQAEILMNQSNITVEKLKNILNKGDIPSLDNFINNELNPVLNSFISIITELISLQAKVGGEVYQNNIKSYHTALRKFLFLIFLSLVFALPLSYYLVRNIHNLINSLRESHKKIKESEEKYRAFIRYAGDSIYILDETMHIIDVNDSGCSLVGYSKDELLKMKISDIIIPEEHHVLSKKVDFINKEGGSVHERRLKRKDGTTVVTEVNVRVLEGVGYISIIRDITERKMEEVKLRLSEERYHSLFENSGEAILLNDTEGHILSANPEACRMFQRTEEDLCQIGRAGIINLNDLRLEPALKGREKTGLLRAELTFIRKDGTVFPCEVNSTVFTDAQGEKRTVIFIHDITRRKKAEEEIRKSEEKYRSLIEHAGDGIFMVGMDSSIIEANQRVCELMGFSREEILSMKSIEFYPPDELAAPPDIDLVMQNHTLLNEVKLLRKDGTKLDVEINRKMIDGLGYLAILRDITQRKQMVAELAEHKEQLTLFIEHSPAALAMFDLDMRYIYTSRRWATDYNLVSQVIIGKTHYEVFPEIPQRWKDIHKRCLQGAIEKCEEDVFTRIDGSKEWLKWEIRPWHKASGEIGGIIIFTETITERKQAEEALYKSNEQYSLLFNQMHNGLMVFEVICDENGHPVDHRFVQGNPAFEQLTGVPLKEQIGRTSKDFAIGWPPDLVQQMYKVAMTGEPIEYERFNETLGKVFETRVFSPRKGFFVHIFTDVTEQKKEKEELLKFKKAIKSSGEIIFLTDKEGLFIYVNPAFTTNYGYSSEEVVGKLTPRILKGGLRNQRQYKSFWGNLLNGNDVRAEYKNKRKDGILIDIEASASTIYDQSKKIVGFVGVQRDITDRKKIEEQLELAASIIDSTDDAIISKTVDGIVTSWNKGAEKALGYSAADIIGRHLSITIPSTLLDEEDEILKNVHAGHYIDHYETKRIKKDGEVIDVSLTISPITDSLGNIVGSSKILRDITERKRAEESIKQSEANYRHLFDLSPAPMWVVDEETYRFIQVNKACINNYGYTEEEFAAMTVENIIPKDNKTDIKNIVNNKNQVNRFFMNEHRHVKKSGELMDVEMSSIPVVLGGKKRILGIAIDVTEKNLYEQKLTSAAIKVQEEERYEIGGELHDNVCQILVASLMFLGMTRKSIPAESKEYFDQTHQYITLASDEIRNLSHRLAPAFFDNATLEDAFQHLLKSFNIENKYEITLDFDIASKSYPVSRDLQLNLYRILQEQLRNILKHSRATSIEVEVTKNDNALQMSISDNGVGFDAKGSKGGIGLANMNRRVRLFSGKFLIQSEVGKGCKVIVEIPLSGNN